MERTREGAPPAPGEADSDGHTILVVDDERAVRSLFATVLRRSGFEAIEAASGPEALATIAEHRVAAVLLDSRMPEMDGVEVLRELRAKERTRTLPVIFVTGEGEVDRRVRALEAGADDYLAKPVSTAELIARVRAQLRGQAAWTRVLEERMRERTELLADLTRQRSGSSLEETATALAHRLAEEDGIAGAAIVMFSHDVAVPAAATGPFAEALRTGRALSQRLARGLHERALRGPWVDAPDAADASPRERPKRRIELPGGEHSVAYTPLVAGDELLGVLGIVDEHTARDVAGRRLALAIDLGEVIATLLHDQRDAWGQHAASREALLRIIEAGAFTAVFQPIRRLADGVALGAEALTRFHDGASPQERFLEAARTGCGIELETATMRRALDRARDLPGELLLGLNLSPRLVVGDPGLPALLDAQSRAIVLELTEHDHIDDYDAVKQAMASFGPSVQVAVDDAGAGYASLIHVLTLAPDWVKLDRLWVQGIDADPARQALVAGLVHFARETGTALVAEGIETAAELGVLRSLGVELGQGFLLDHPSPHPVLERPSIFG